MRSERKPRGILGQFALSSPAELRLDRRGTARSLMCRWMGSHFHGWIDYNGVAFSMALLEWGRTFSDFGSKKILPIYGYRG